MSRKWGNNKRMARKAVRAQKYALRMTERRPDLPTVIEGGEIKLDRDQIYSPGVRPSWLRGCGKVPANS